MCTVQLIQIIVIVGVFSCHLEPETIASNYIKPIVILMLESRFLPIALLKFGALYLQQSCLVIMCTFLNVVRHNLVSIDFLHYT